MKKKNYYQEREHHLMCHEIYRLRVVEGLEVAAIVEKLGISRSRVYRA